MLDKGFNYSKGIFGSRVNSTVNYGKVYYMVRSNLTLNCQLGSNSVKNYFDLYINSLTFKSLWHFGSTCQNPPLFCSLDYHLYSKKDKYQKIDDKFNQRKKKLTNILN